MSDFNKLKEFINLAKEEGVAELKYENDDQKFYVSFASSQAIVSHSPSPMAAVRAEQDSAAVMQTSAPAGNFHEITSPFVGTYYSSPAPGKPEFVKVGDRVSKGQTLCILEAMKIMNEIESDIDGEVVEITATNESLVEFGQVLFRIKA